jgi:regulator of RNase E activity RraB
MDKKNAEDDAIDAAGMGAEADEAEEEEEEEGKVVVVVGTATKLESQSSRMSVVLLKPTRKSLPPT